jgi:hypothetical protein
MAAGRSTAIRINMLFYICMMDRCCLIPLPPGITWIGEWTETAGKLMQEGKVKPFIVVAIWNTGTKRHIEYFRRNHLNRLARFSRILFLRQTAVMAIQYLLLIKFNLMSI